MMNPILWWSKARPCRHRFGLGGIMFAHWFLFGMLYLELSSYAQTGKIELRALSRSAGQIGSSFEIQVESGEALDECDQMTFSHPEIMAHVITSDPLPLQSEPEKQYKKFKVHIGPQVPLGIYDVRVAGRFGISNPRAFLVTEVAHAVGGQGHLSREQALPLTDQVLLHDCCAVKQRKYYRLPAVAGQTIRILGLDQLLDSQANLRLALREPGGKLLAESRTQPGEVVHLNYTSDRDGELFLEVHDFLYRGGPEFFYCLIASQLPHGLDGLELEKSWEKPLSICWKTLKAAAETMLISQCVSASPWNGRVESVLASRLSRLEIPMILEGAQPASPHQTLPIPCGVLGEIGESTIADTFQFQASAGQVLWIELFSQSLGESTDLQLLVQKVNQDPLTKSEKVDAIADKDDGDPVGGIDFRVRTLDPVLRFQAPSQGIYQVSIRDQQRNHLQSSKRLPRYLLTLHEAAPDFDVIAYRDYPTNNLAQSRVEGSSLMKLGFESIHVLAIRRDGFDAAIEVEAIGLPAGVSCKPIMISKGQNDGYLVLESEESAPRWVGQIAIRATSGVGEHTMRREAHSGSLLWPSTPTYTAIRSRRSSGIELATSEADRFPMSTRIGDQPLSEIARGGKLEIPIRIKRTEQSKSDCIFRAKNLPSKFLVPEVKLEAAKSETNLVLQVEPDTPSGEYTFWVQNETKIKIRMNQEALTRAEAYRDKLKAAIQEPGKDSEKPALETSLKTVMAKIEELKKTTAEKEQQVFIPIPLPRIRVVETPFQLHFEVPEKSHPSKPVDILIFMDRHPGFEGPIRVDQSTLVLQNKIDLELESTVENKDLYRLRMTLPLAMAAGNLSIPIKIHYQYNQRELSSQATLAINVTPPSTN